MRPLTAESIQQLYATMTQSYDTFLVNNMPEDQRQTAMETLLRYLKALGCDEPGEFLRCCDISIGDDIYLPYALEDNKYTLPVKAAIAAKTHQRILTQRESTLGECSLRYLLSPTLRAMCEAKASRAAYEVLLAHSRTHKHFLYMKLVDAVALKHLHYYGIKSHAQIDVVRQYLISAEEEINQGKVTCAPAADVIAFFGWTAQ